MVTSGVQPLLCLHSFERPFRFYGPAGSQHVRMALTATDERIDAVVARLAAWARRLPTPPPTQKVPSGSRRTGPSALVLLLGDQRRPMFT
jgi:hypothetical protein